MAGKLAVPGGKVKETPPPRQSPARLPPDGGNRPPGKETDWTFLLRKHVVPPCRMHTDKQFQME